MSITIKDFGQGYHLLVLTNKHGLRLAVTDLGGRVSSA